MTKCLKFKRIKSSPVLIRVISLFFFSLLVFFTLFSSFLYVHLPSCFPFTLRSVLPSSRGVSLAPSLSPVAELLYQFRLLFLGSCSSDIFSPPQPTVDGNEGFWVLCGRHLRCPRLCGLVCYGGQVAVWVWAATALGAVTWPIIREILTCECLGHGIILIYRGKVFCLVGFSAC